LRKRTIHFILSITGIALLFLTLTPLFLGYVVGPRIARRVLEQKVQEFLEQGIEVGGAGLTILGGIGVEYRHVTMVDPLGKEIFRAETIRLKPWIRSLLAGRLEWRRVAVRNPSVRLMRTPGGEICLSPKGQRTSGHRGEDLFQGLGRFLSRLPSQFSLRGGKIRFTDAALSQGPLVFDLEEIDISAHAASPEEPLSFLLQGRFVGDLQRFSVSGDLSPVTDGVDPNRREYQIALGIRDLGIRWLRPYLRSVLPLQEMRGLIDLRTTWRGSPAAYRLSGDMTIRDGAFLIPAFFETAIEPQKVSVAYDFEYEGDEIRIPRLALRTPQMSVLGSGSVRGLTRGSEPSVSLKVTSEAASLEKIAPYLPGRLVPRKLVSLLRRSRAQGFLTVEEAIIEASWKDIRAGELLKHPEMLAVRLRIEDGTVQFDSNLPPLQKVSGVLQVRGDHLTVEAFRGQFQRSRLEVNGSISSIRSDPSMAIKLKGDLDLKNILGLMKGSQMPVELRRALQPIMKMSGKASVAGEIRHILNRPAALSYQGRISIRHASVMLRTLALPLTDMEGDVRVNEREIVLSDFKGKVGESPCQGHFSIRDYLPRHGQKLALSRSTKIRFGLSARKIRIDDFFREVGKKGEIQIDPESIWLHGTILGEVDVSHGSFKGFPLDHLQTSFTAKGGLVRLKSFHLTAPGGFIRCKGWISLGPKQRLAFKLVPMIHRLSIGSVLHFFTPQGKGVPVSGALSLEGILAGGGDSLDDIMRSLYGDLRLSAEESIIYGLKDRRNEGVPFRGASGRILLEKGVASTEDLCLEGDAMSMVIRGQASLSDRTLDVCIRVRPFQTVDRIISSVPVAGWLLAGRDRSILTFAYRVRGPFGHLVVEGEPSLKTGSMTR
jgi:hypothetical protein